MYICVITRIGSSPLSIFTKKNPAFPSRTRSTYLLLSPSLQYRESNNTKGNDGKMEKTEKPVSPQKKIIQEPEGNEENRYSDPDSNKTKINFAKEPKEAHKNNLKEEILQIINENFIEMILDMVNQNV
jgi:hypothetical protein